MLERILDRLGLLERQDSYLQNDIEESDIVEVTLGNAVQIFNSHNRFDCYCFAIRGGEHSQVNICLKVNQNPLDYHLAKFSKTIPNTLIDFQIFEYSPSKDPPLFIR